MHDKDLEDILEDRHSHSIIKELLRHGGEARYSTLRRLTDGNEEAHSIPIQTFHRRLKELLSHGIIETTDTDYAYPRIYWISLPALRVLEPCFRRVTEIISKYEAKKKVFLRNVSLQSSFQFSIYEVLHFVFQLGFLSGLMKSGSGFENVFRAIVEEVTAFYERVLPESFLAEPKFDEEWEKSGVYDQEWQKEAMRRIVSMSSHKQ